MSSKSNAPTIIRRKKVIASGGHNGGAWKVAYADFVTAMMAFFLLMWLLNATTETQRTGLADYFNPSIPISRTSGAGEGMLAGKDVFSDREDMASGVGQATTPPSKDVSSGAMEAPKLPEALAQIEEALSGSSGESLVADDLLRHIVTRVTDEGLIVDLFDLPGAPLFHSGTDTPTRLMTDLTAAVAEVFRMAANDIAINGHVRARAVVLKDNPSWDLSSTRAQQTRGLVTHRFIAPDRVARVSGFADRKPIEADPMDVRNNRIELILLRDLPQGAH